MSLYIGKNHKDAAPVQSIFRLAGNDEDALTYALGYLLAYDPGFCTDLLRRLRIVPGSTPKPPYSVHLQEVKGAGYGRRDIVVESGDTRIVFEAKVGNAEPKADQLLKYVAEMLQSKHSRCVIVALTRGELQKETEELVRSGIRKRLRKHQARNSAKKQVDLCKVQWHQIIDLVSHHESNTVVGKYLFDQFTRYIRSDYNMGYHDAEIEIQDTNLLNATIYNKGWMYVGSAKNAPLYFAPYFTKQVVGKKSDSGIANGMDHGIAMISRVKDTVVVKNADIQSINPNSIPGTEGQRGKWAIGLHEIQKRVENEGWEPDKELRLLFLDRPIPLLKPITKDAWNGTKKIPTQIPKGFSLQFDELLTGIVEPNG